MSHDLIIVSIDLSWIFIGCPNIDGFFSISYLKKNPKKTGKVKLRIKIIGNTSLQKALAAKWF